MKQYEINVIQSDLRHEEIIVQAINTFEHIENIANDVFNKIESQIEVRLNKISEINSRIAKVSSQIDSLKGVKKSIKIFSPAKYPAADKIPEITSNFSEIEPSKVHVNSDYKIEISHDFVERQPIVEKLQFFHVKKSHKPIKKPSNIAFNITSVNSSIIFNTNENLLVSDDTSKSSVTSKNKNELEQHDEDITDFSKLTRKILMKPGEKGLGYSPLMNDAPQIDAPMNLPDIEGLADDIQYNQRETDKSIAPSSLLSMTIIGDLPDVPLEEEMDKKDVDMKKDDVKTIKQESVPVPPPIPQELIKINQDKAPASSNVTNSSIPIPPPPPPPMPPAFLITASQQPVSSNPKTESAPKQSKAQPPADDRGRLMEQIRQAGMKVLKKAGADAKPIVEMEKESTKDEPSTSKKPGDLMSDLREKLLMRRQGISGANQGAEQTDAKGMLGQLSKLIPPPNKTQIKSSDDDSDTTDWE